jgi:hypothetical protein
VCYVARVTNDMQSAIVGRFACSDSVVTEPELSEIFEESVMSEGWVRDTSMKFHTCCRATLTRNRSLITVPHLSVISVWLCTAIWFQTVF